MPDIASADIPLAVDRVDRAPGEREGVTLRMTGRWLRSLQTAEGEPLFVVQVQGRRHRFPPADGGSTADGSGTTSDNEPWAATFNIPSWAEPSREGQAALWVGTAVVAVPLPGLEQRDTDVARLQGLLAHTRSELEARTATQVALESAHNDLRGDLQELVSAVRVQREDLEKRLAAAEDRRAAAEAERDRLHEELARARAATQVSRDAAVVEAAGLQAELERLGSELAVTREHHAAHDGDLGEAQRLLAEARSLREQLRAQTSQ